ncbi:Short-chain alcohol dehydrogenase [Halanaeroarchaeum sp. HSR-CO]|uniref:SDR family oxidoreductase n=1 Tax=Halanaeroarchaeum sp. HSR-CO TaxID=2866382 RepID=UPI00217F1E29|nr:SDR family oxidoreductase [Halanaeroarchaeum sp. HSR-CO]UWG46332.1 Short-chain alcohol dehydrogenase [Halanaeroarchaeum sp. HSR-CO]
MELGIAGNTAIVTAGGNGLGKATAMEFAREGANVVINDISQEALDEATAEISAVSESGAEVLAVQGDLTSAADIQELVAVTVDEFGGIDHLVTSAGGPPSGPFLEMDDDDWQFAYELLVMSVVRLCREAYPHLKEDGGGTIVNSTSRSVKEAIDGLVLSNAVRSGVAGLAKTLSIEFAPDVRTNVVMPGPTETQRQVDLINAAIDRGEYDSYEAAVESKSQGIPLGRLGKPDEFGEFVVMLSSPVASYVNGTAIAIDGGAMSSNV